MKISPALGLIKSSRRYFKKAHVRDRDHAYRFLRATACDTVGYVMYSRLYLNLILNIKAASLSLSFSTVIGRLDNDLPAEDFSAISETRGRRKGKPAATRGGRTCRSRVALVRSIRLRGNRTRREFPPTGRIDSTP